MSNRLPLTRRALAELAAQHDALRGMMDRCEELADELDAGRMGPMQLTREVARLRLAFDAHNKFEEQLLRPVLLANPSLGERRIEYMVEEHAREHRSMRQQLGSNATVDLRAVIGSLRAHLAAEERYFATAERAHEEALAAAEADASAPADADPPAPAGGATDETRGAATPAPAPAADAPRDSRRDKSAQLEREV